MELKGQEYGTRAAQVAQQQAVVPEQEWAPPPAPVPLDAPTMFPDQPVTHGLPSGPGAGPEVLDLDETDELRALYLETGNEAIRELIEAMEEGW